MEKFFETVKIPATVTLAEVQKIMDLYGGNSWEKIPRSYLVPSKARIGRVHLKTYAHAPDFLVGKIRLDRKERAVYGVFGAGHADFKGNFVPTFQVGFAECIVRKANYGWELAGAHFQSLVQAYEWVKIRLEEQVGEEVDPKWYTPFRFFGTGIAEKAAPPTSFWVEIAHPEQRGTQEYQEWLLSYGKGQWLRYSE